MRTLLTLGMLALTALSLALGGCDGGGADEADVVLYTSIDEPVARAIVEAFEAETGHTVRLVTDTEATKSVGLAERLRAEKNRPQADVWWGNEPFHTIALAEEGLLAPYDSPAAADIDPLFKDPQNRWAGNGLRARVLAVPKRTGTLTTLPAPLAATRLEDLLDPKLKGKIVLARPTAGTTGSHVAAIYVAWGIERADSFFRGLHDNRAAVVGGNSQAAQQVGAGNYLIGLTDNDDVANADAAGGDVRAVLPDQGEGEMGTLTLPTTVGLIASRPENAAARKLVDHLLSARTERNLAKAQFAAYSVRASDRQSAVKSMQVDYAEVARQMPGAVRRATALLEGREPD
jgi:iron(III) transport system substrate-binding protein